MHLDLWTLALQTINVLVLVWLLAHFLFRPITALIAERRAAADALLAEAEATRAKAAAEANALTQQRDELANDGERIAAAAHASAEAERTEVLHRADEAASKLRADALQAINHDREEMRRKLEDEAADLGVTIAQRLLERLPAQVLNNCFLEGLAEVVATHPARASLLRGDIELRSAVPLDETTQAECKATLTRLLGSPPALSFRTDPNLLAGYELISPYAEIRNSWQADLERITHALRDEHEHVA
jgi:F-type H+-transporting ATPase subunit b